MEHHEMQIDESDYQRRSNSTIKVANRLVVQNNDQLPLKPQPNNRTAPGCVNKRETKKE